MTIVVSSEHNHGDRCKSLSSGIFFGLVILLLVFTECLYYFFKKMGMISALVAMLWKISDGRYPVLKV